MQAARAVDAPDWQHLITQLRLLALQFVKRVAIRLVEMAILVVILIANEIQSRLEFKHVF